MEALIYFFNLPLQAFLSIAFFIILLSPIFKITIIVSILFYSLGLSSFAGRLSVLGISVALSFFAIQADLEKSLNHAHQNSTKGSSQDIIATEFLESWKKNIISKVSLDAINNFTQIASTSSSDSNIDTNSWKILAPAYILSELKTGLSVGLRLLLPFLVIDLIIAALFSALDIKTINSNVIAFPLKLLAFLSVDGITLVSKHLLSLSL